MHTNYSSKSKSLQIFCAQNIIGALGSYMGFEQLKLDKQVCHRLYIASNGITRLYRPMLEELGLTYPQYIIMMALWEKDKTTVQQLQKCTKIDGGSLTQILKKLCSKSYISLDPIKEDRRVKMVNLTNEGRALEEKASSVPEKMYCKFDGLDPQDLEDLKRILDRINSEME